MGEVEGTVLGELLLIHRSEFSELDFFSEFQIFRVGGVRVRTWKRN
jgi:hypothetical protein